MKAFLLTALCTAILVGAAWGLWHYHEPLLAQRWYEQLQNGSENETQTRLDQLASLGPVGIPFLVVAMDDPREGVALRARRTIWDAIGQWEKMPSREAVARLRALVEALDARVESFGPAARWEAGQLAVRLLQWPLDGTRPEGRRVVTACERILACTGPSLPGEIGPRGAVGSGGPAVSGDGSATSARSPPDDPNYATLLAAPKLPGGGLPLETAPIPSGASGLASSSGRSPAGDGVEPNPLRISGPLETARRPAEPAPSGDRRDSASTEGRSNQGAQISPIAPLSHVAPQPNPAAAPDSQNGEDLVRWMRDLRSSDPRTVDDARFALSLRGFSKTHLELAERMFDPDVEKRKQTARALPTLPGVDASPWLLLLARDANAEVRATALGLLSTAPDPALAAKARQIASEDPDPAVQARIDSTKRKRGGSDESPH